MSSYFITWIIIRVTNGNEISERVRNGGSRIIPTLREELCIGETIGAALVADHLKNGFYAVLKEDGLEISAFLFEKYALYV